MPIAVFTTRVPSRPASRGSCCRIRNFPRSALFCLEGMKRALNATLGDRPAKGADTPLKHCARVMTELNFIDMATYFPRAGEGSASAGDDDLSDMPHCPNFPRSSAS